LEKNTFILIDNFDEMLFKFTKMRLILIQNERDKTNINILEICFSKLLTKNEKTKKQAVEIEEEIETSKITLKKNAKKIKRLNRMVEEMNKNPPKVENKTLSKNKESPLDEDQDDAAGSLLFAGTSTPAPPKRRSLSDSDHNNSDEAPSFNNDSLENETNVDTSPRRVVNSTAFDTTAPFSPIDISPAESSVEMSRIHERLTTRRNLLFNNLPADDHLGLHLSSQNGSQEDLNNISLNETSRLNGSRHPHMQSTSRLSFDGNRTGLDGISNHSHNRSTFTDMTAEMPNDIDEDWWLRVRIG
jgi:hypothetical protein